MNEAAKELIGKKFPVLNDGYVMLVDVMGDDGAITEDARLTAGDLAAEIHTDAEDRGLIRYLVRHDHGTPLEMVDFKFKWRLPMDALRQLIRHRIASFNEYSTRYSTAIDSCQITSPDEWRTQATGNRQGSGDFLTEWPADVVKPENLTTLERANVGEYLSSREAGLQDKAREVYEERLALGVAKEQARKDLPLSTYTELIMKINLRSLMNLLSLRMDSHAQLEIRSYANIIGEQIVSKVCPWAWEAFNDYDKRRDAVLITRLDKEVVRAISSRVAAPPYSEQNVLATWEYVTGSPAAKRNRERDECLVKLRKLGLVEE